MKVLVVSDVVNRRLYSPYIKDFAGNVELIISCGDLPAYYLDYIVSSLCKPLIYICGNHDHYDGPKKDDFFSNPIESSFKPLDYSSPNQRGFGGRDLDNKTEIYKGLIYGGLEGSILYNFGEHQYSEFQMRSKIARMTPGLWINKLVHGRSLDVFITHAPPRGIHDLDDQAHRGFEAYLDFIKYFKPKYLLHGHTHLYDSNINRVFTYMETKIINCYDYQILDLEID